MKNYALIALIASVLAFALTAAAPLQTAPPGTLSEVTPALLFVIVNSAVSIFVVDGLKRMSESYKSLPDLTGWGTVIASAITSWALAQINMLFSRIPVDAQAPALFGVIWVLVIGLPIVTTYLRKRLFPATAATIPRASVG